MGGSGGGSSPSSAFKSSSTVENVGIPKQLEKLLCPCAPGLRQYSSGSGEGVSSSGVFSDMNMLDATESFGARLNCFPSDSTFSSFNISCSLEQVCSCSVDPLASARFSPTTFSLSLDSSIMSIFNRLVRACSSSTSPSEEMTLSQKSTFVVDPLFASRGVLLETDNIIEYPARRISI